MRTSCAFQVEFFISADYSPPTSASDTASAEAEKAFRKQIYRVRQQDKPSAAHDGVMTPQSFKKWRKSLKLSQKDAARVLGLKRRILQYYEKGERDGVPIEIPLTVRLACCAIANGFSDYSGPKDD